MIPCLSLDRTGNFQWWKKKNTSFILNVFCLDPRLNFMLNFMQIGQDLHMFLLSQNLFAFLFCHSYFDKDNRRIISTGKKAVYTTPQSRTDGQEWKTLKNNFVTNRRTDGPTARHGKFHSRVSATKNSKSETVY